MLPSKDAEIFAAQVAELRTHLLNSQMLAVLSANSHRLPEPVLDELIAVMSEYRGRQMVTADEFLALRTARRVL